MKKFILILILFYLSCQVFAQKDGFWNTEYVHDTITFEHLSSISKCNIWSDNTTISTMTKKLF